MNVGHGLEGDFNSAWYFMIGRKVASDGVTIIDDGTIDKRRGSLNIDEGTPTEKTFNRKWYIKKFHAR